LRVVGFLVSIAFAIVGLVFVGILFVLIAFLYVH
jgi:hypothetical protein